MNTIGSVTYYAQANDGTCNSLTRTPVTLTINAAPAAPVSGGNITQCEQSPIQTLTATATVLAGETLSWYNAASGGAIVATPTLNTTGSVTYYAEASNGCPSTTRTAVTLTIDSVPAGAPVSGGNITQCEQSPIQTLTATATVAVGQTLSWFNAATGGAAVATPTLNALGSVTYYAEANNGCPSLTRTPVTLTINAVPAAPVSGGNITQCEQSPIQTLTATATVGAGETVTWYNASTGGTTVASATHNTTGTLVLYAEASNGNCVSINRTPVTLTINAAPAAPLSTGNITQCEQAPIQTLDANNAISPILGITTTWYNAATGGTIIALPTLNSVGSVTYYAEANDGTCSSLTRTPVTLTINGAPAASVSTGNITQCEQLPIQTLNANNAITTVVGQTTDWFTAATAGTSVALPTLNTVSTITFYAQSNDGTCSALSRTAVTLTINPAPAAPSSTGNISQCEQSPIQTLDANNAITPVVGQTIDWFNAASGGIAVPLPTLNTIGTVTYYAESNDSTCSSNTRTAVTLTIIAPPAAPISTGNITQCEQSPMQTLDANNAITPVTGQTISWFTAATAGSSVATPILNSVGSTTYYAEANDTTCASLTRTAVTLTINGAPVAPVSTGNITQCEQSPIQTLDANNAITPVLGQTIDWYTAATAGTSVALPTLSSTGTITYYAESNDGTCTSYSRTAVTLTINAAPAAPVSTGNITQCEQLPIQTLDANNAIAPVLGQTIDWFTAATAGTTVLFPTLNTTGTVTYYAEANDGTCSSLTRTAVTLTINAAPAASVSTGNITQCEQSPIQTLDANNSITSVIGQTTDWFTAATGGTTVLLPTLNTTGTVTYYAEANDGTCSALTRTAVTLTIDAAPAAPVSTGNITQCEQLPIQTLDANNAITLVPGQTTDWYTAATAGTPVLLPTLNTPGTVTYYAEANDGTCRSLTRTAVTLTINAAPAAPVSTGNITQCEISPIQTLDANNAITAVTGQTTDWFTAATAGTAVLSPTLNTTGTVTYYAQANDGTCSSLTRTAVVLTLNAAPFAPISNGNITQCEQSPIQTLNAVSAITPLPGQNVSWYTSAVGGTLVPIPTWNSTGSITYYGESNDGTCPSYSRTPITLTINAAPAAPAVSGNITQCEQLPIQTLNANSVVTPILGQTVNWFSSATGGTAVISPTLNTTGTITYYGQSNDGSCNSLTRTTVTLTIDAAPAAPVSSGNITQCEQSPIQTLNASTAITPIPGQTVNWFSSATGGTAVISPTLNTTGTITYYGESNDGTCNSLTRTAVTLTINAAPSAPISTGNITQCEQSPIQTLDASNAITPVAGQTVDWFTTATGGTLIASATLNTPGTITYYGQANDGSCSSLTRTAVTLTINAAPAAPVSSGNITQCQIAPLQTLNANTAVTVSVGQNITWFDAATGGLSVTNPTLNSIGNITYYAQANDATCSSFTRTSVTLTINPAPAAPVSAGDIFQCVQTPIQTITAVATAPGLTITWFNAPVGGSVVTPSINTAISVIYYAESSDGICPSLTRTPVILTIDPLPLVPTIGAITQPDCTTATGSATIFPVQAGVTYSLDNGPFTTTAFYSGLSAGIVHTIVAKSTGGCVSAPALVNILAQPSTPAAPTFVVTQPSCTLATGTITINGVTGETYSFDGGPYLSNLIYSGLLESSTHTIKAKNAAGCTSPVVTVTLDVQPLTPASPTLTPIHPTCTVATGTVVVSGVIGLTYSLDGGPFTSTLNYNLLPGGVSYNVSAMNSSGCISAPSTISLNPQPPTPATPSYVTAQPNCTVALGEININAVAGELYSFDGSGYSNTLFYGNLAPGTYDLTAQNGFGCISPISSVVINPQPITATPAVTDGVICIDSLTGNVINPLTLNTRIDPATHTFAWTIDGVTQANTSAIFVATQPGIYTVTATNNGTGCNSSTVTINVTESNPALGITTQINGQFTNDASVIVTVNTGTGPFLYQLDYGPPQQSNLFTNIAPGTHKITVEDENGCTYITTEFVILGYMNFFSPNNDGFNDTWNVIGLKDQPSAKVYIFDRHGKFIKQVIPTGEGWDGTFNGQPLPSTDYWFRAEYTENGQSKEFKSHFSLVR
ncbi:Ig-like domain-containing protein [Flavobacterium lotistagni]|uniref:Ig-like domain-containing protein n=1 Tax=Flavobacterium lotistagni TaxID=2709660 RepID=UPI001A9C55FA|nr:T9SS type B sorting domain-containing protein [Flavobacterium lotistagni]